MSDGETAEFLATLPLFEGRETPELLEVARLVRRRTVREGELLWQQGEEARELVFVVEGSLAASLHVPGARPVEMGRAGRGETVGEIALLDGGEHTMSVQAAEGGTVLALSRPDFAAMLARRHPATFSLKRRLASLLTARLRNQLAHLAASLGEGSPADDEPGAIAELELCGPPDSKYIRRMTTFHDFDPVALWGFLTSGSYAQCARGRTLLTEGAPSTAYYLTIKGAVETVLIRGNRRIRVGLAGPGRAFGYESLIDGRPSPVTAIARERALLLVLPHDPFQQLFNGEDAISHVFLDVIQRDVTAALRQTLRPHARFAASL